MPNRSTGPFLQSGSLPLDVTGRLVTRGYTGFTWQMPRPSDQPSAAISSRIRRASQIVSAIALEWVFTDNSAHSSAWKDASDIYCRSSILSDVEGTVWLNVLYPWPVS